MTLPALAIPGQLLGPTSAYLPGAGVHTYNSHLYASIAGVPTTPHTAPSNSSKPSASTSKPHPPTTCSSHDKPFTPTSHHASSYSDPCPRLPCWHCWT
ncbi:exosome 3'-_5 exonuclease subunit ski4 (Csl4), partial [Acarospora aff. strigata]|nr:exosome 3'->5 exonuclease subunit ski4 (Csl4) [Acarospora aff. strigata]